MNREPTQILQLSALLPPSTVYAKHQPPYHHPTYFDAYCIQQHVSLLANHSCTFDHFIGEMGGGKTAPTAIIARPRLQSSPSQSCGRESDWTFYEVIKYPLVCTYLRIFQSMQSGRRFCHARTMDEGDCRRFWPRENPGLVSWAQAGDLCHRSHFPERSFHQRIRDVHRPSYARSHR